MKRIPNESRLWFDPFSYQTANPIGQALGGVESKNIGPGAGWLLQVKPGPQPVLVCIGHGIAGEGAVFGEKLTRHSVSIFGGADAVHHVCEAIERIIALQWGASCSLLAECDLLDLTKQGAAGVRLRPIELVLHCV